MVILSAFFVVTQLVTESSRLPDVLRTIKLPFGHPIAIAVALWVARDFIRRLRRNIPFDAETASHELADAFESGPRARESLPAPTGAPNPAPAPAMRRR
jgi:hypothetical protein